MDEFNKITPVLLFKIPSLSETLVDVLTKALIKKNGIVSNKINELLQHDPKI
jgi:hypothetical protein